MIEKIWKLTEKGIKDYNGKVGSVEEVVEVLNTYHFMVNDYLRENNKLKQENEKLTVQKLEIKKWVNDKISDLEKKYEFGQTEYKGCPMHNIQFGINILKELREYWEEQEND